MAAASISVVVPSAGNLNGVRRLLKTLEEQSVAVSDFEVIIVDTSDSTAINDWLANEATLLDVACYSCDNPSLATALNKGIDQASNDCVLFLNDNCFAPRDLILAHQEAHRDNQHKAIRGPMLPVDANDPQLFAEHLHFAPLGFSIYNSSIPKMGLVLVDCFDPDLDDEQAAPDLHWRLQPAKYSEKFVPDAFCFQDSASWPGRDLAGIKAQAVALAQAALNFARTNGKANSAANKYAAAGWSPWRLAMLQLEHNFDRWLRTSNWGASPRIRAYADQRVFDYYYQRMLHERQAK